MSEQGLVSVIIPSYKGSDTIKDVVNSVSSQTYDKIEIIVIDDNGKGSTEQLKTEKAIEEFKVMQGFHYLVHEVNKNGSAARNTGLRACHGEYVAFLDDDDYFYPEKIARSVDVLSKLSDEYAMVYTSLELGLENGKIQKLVMDDSDDIFIDFLMGKLELCSSSVLVRKSVLTEINGFDESFRRHQDWELFTRILSKYKAAFIKDILLKKVMLRRNDPKAEQFEKNRLHFLETLKYIFDELPENVKPRFYDRHYYPIAKAYFKERNFKKTIYWLRRTSRPFYFTFQIAKDALAYLKKKL